MPNSAALLPLSSVLDWAREQMLTGAVIVGRLPDGSIKFASTSGDQAECLALLKAAEMVVGRPQPVDKRETQVVSEA